MIYINRFDRLGLRILGGFFAAILLPAVAHSETNRIVLHENFESYRNTRALRAAWPGGPAALLTNVPGGGRCVSHDGTGMNRRGGFFIFPDETHHVVLEADFYDFGTNTERNVTLSLNGEDSHENVAFGLKGPFCYVARAGGLSVKTNWIPFKRGQLPVEGWHHFKGVVTMTNFIATLDFGRDGKVDRKMQIPFNKPPPTFTQMRFGGYSGKLAAGGTVLVDNIKLQLVPVTPPPVPAPVATVLTNQQASAITAESQRPTSVKTNEIPAAATNSVAAVQTNIALLATRESAAASKESESSAMVRVDETNRQQEAAVTTGAMSQSVPMAIRWIGAALGLIIVLLGLLILMVRRQVVRNPRALLANSSEGGAGAAEALALAGNADAQWRERALQAEAIVARQAQFLKEKVGPELVQFAKETLVQGLYNQRNVLLETQAQARQTLTELENRLSELKLPSQERITVYEKRIAELEKQLESRNDEMRELTRATLLMIQEKLVQERAAQPQRFN